MAISSNDNKETWKLSSKNNNGRYFVELSRSVNKLKHPVLGLKSTPKLTLFGVFGKAPHPEMTFAVTPAK